MKKYPYNDSTDLVIYDVKRGCKNKKSKTWLVAIASAVTASICTAVVFGLMFVPSQNAQNINSNKPPVLSTATSGNNDQSSAAMTLANKKDGEVLTIPEIAAKVGPSVVGVINKTTVQPQQYWNPYSGRYYYYTDPAEDGETIEQGSGSGIILSENGYIVTNQHVISGATEIEVVLNTGSTFSAKLIGEDVKTDLAVLKIEPGDEKLTAATLGDSTTVQVGELAVAIGNPMGMEFSGSVTAGIISAVNRTIKIENSTYNLLQTDAAINNGNSGGALINQYGEVIGINSVKLSTTGVEGMGFAIAISEAKPILNDLMNSGYVKGRPLVGIGITETIYGLFISTVQEGSGAEEAGLKVDDMIIAVDDKKVKTTDEINEIRDTKKPGDILTFKILRDGETHEIDVTLKEDVAQKQ